MMRKLVVILAVVACLSTMVAHIASADGKTMPSPIETLGVRSQVAR